MSDRGGRLTDCSARYSFATVCQSIGLRPAEKFHRHGRGPRIHDLRHTFAVRALETCPDGRDRIARHMLALSTYLGHSKAAYTYWYLEATPELMRNIADSSESYFTGGRP